MRFALVCVPLLLLASCSDDNALTVRKLLIDIEPSANGPQGEVNRELVVGVVQDELERDRDVKLAGVDKGDVLRVRIESTSMSPTERGGLRGTLSLSLELSGKDARGIRHRYGGSAVASEEAREAGAKLDVDALVRSAFRDAFSQVMLARGASSEPTETLLVWLNDKSLEARTRRLQAIRILGARREASALDGLTKAIKSADDDVSHAALGALTLVGDPRAASAVIEYAEKKPARVRKQAIEAARVMGARPAGTDDATRGVRLATAWLFTLSTGHPDRDVQMAAQAALEQLEGSPKQEVAQAPVD